LGCALYISCALSIEKYGNSLQGKSPKNEWWDKECRQVIKQKNRARMKCLQQKTTANKEQYKGREKKQIKYVNKK
jgi:hypothetical protein